MHAWLSRRYYANRARRARIATDREISERDALFYSEEAIHRHQLARLSRLLEHAGDHVPYYRDLFRKHGFDHRAVTSVHVLTQLPVLDKADIRSAGDRLLSEAIPASARYRNASGGSTGAPLQFYQDSTYERAGQLSATLFDMWTGWRRGEAIALLWGAPTDIARYGLFRQRLRLALQNRFLVDAFDLYDAKLRDAVNRICRRRPALVVAYAGAAYLVARYIREQGIQLKHSPRAVVTSAEVLQPHYRPLIESQFGCKVFNRYGSREVGVVAMECPSGSMHVNALDVLVEVHQPGTDGTGELLITQLNNLVFPLIRYRIGDLGAMQAIGCACGRRLPSLSWLSGRISDFITAPDGTRIHGEWFTHLFYGVGGIELFTFRQVGPRRYVFAIKRGSGFESTAFDDAIEKARDRLGSNALVEVTFVDRFEASPSGKHRFVVNEHADSVSGSVR
jgi:phenylacetate-CoA ligase